MQLISSSSQMPEFLIFSSKLYLGIGCQQKQNFHFKELPVFTSS
jgi:hypothetical protein